MKYFLSIIMFSTFILPCFAGEEPGFSQLKTSAADGHQLELSIWYPAREGAAQEIGGNAVFKGAEAAPDAAVKDGQFPLVVLSHGGLRSAQNSGAWLSAALAQSGFIVAEMNGPRPANASAGVNEIWQRANDFSVALDGLLNDEKWSSSIDRKSVSAVGYALGGTASLAIAGAAFDLERFIRACDDDMQSGPDCGWYSAQNVTLDSVDKAALVKNRFDPRFSTAIAIAPEYMDVFSHSAAKSETPKMLIMLGGDDGLVRDGKGARTTFLGEASLYDGFALCTAAGPEILQEDGGNSAICGVSQETRKKVHEAIADEIRLFLAGERPAAE